jgi:flagellar biosynthesis protein FlhG
MSAIYNLEADYIVLDLSAGTHNTTLDFFLMAHYHIVVFTPEPSSIENAYRFMKSSFFRKIKRFEKHYGLEEAVAEIMTQKEKYQIKQPADLILALNKLHPEKAYQLQSELNKLKYHIILNQTRSHKDIEIGASLKTVSNKFFGLPTEFVGHLEYDNAVWQSLRKRKPLLVEYPHSRLYAQILNIAKSIAYSNKYKAVV